MYFLIWGTEDGTQIAQYEDEEQLRAVLAEDAENGLVVKFIPFEDFDAINCDDGTYVLIQGEEMKPKPKKVVSDWDFA